MIDKDNIIEEATMYLNGFSLRKIADAKGVSYVKVRSDLVDRLPLINRVLAYAVKEAMEDNRPKSIEDENVQKRVLLAYKLLVEDDKTVLEIAEAIGETEFTIYRDLTRRLTNLYKNGYPFVTKDMLENVSNILTKHSIENSPHVSESRGL